ncbi:MAG: hypothetical protein ABW162_03010 [Candidatus Sedimenticola sp. PURPLELP]
MIPIKFQVVGEEDYAYSVEINSAGEYRVSTGTYTSHEPTTGRLDSEQKEALMSALQELGIPEAHPVPAEGKAFNAMLVIGEEGEEVEYPFWEGALEEDLKLRALVRLLEKL